MLVLVTIQYKILLLQPMFTITVKQTLVGSLARGFPNVSIWITGAVNLYLHQGRHSRILQREMSQFVHQMSFLTQHQLGLCIPWNQTLNLLSGRWEKYHLQIILTKGKKSLFREEATSLRRKCENSHSGSHSGPALEPGQNPGLPTS